MRPARAASLPFLGLGVAVGGRFCGASSLLCNCGTFSCYCDHPCPGVGAGNFDEWNEYANGTEQALAVALGACGIGDGMGAGIGAGTRVDVDAGPVGTDGAWRDLYRLQPARRTARRRQ